MEDLITIYDPEQSWSDEVIEEIKREHLVIFNRKWRHAVRIIPRENTNPLFQILVEDDGALFVSNRQGLEFDMHWTDSIIEALTEAKKYWEEIKNNY